MTRVLLVALATVLLAPPAAATEPAPAAGAKVVIADGHVDLGPRFVDGRWTVQIRDDRTDTAVWRSPDDVVLQATGRTRTTVPADPAYAFLGRAGSQVYVIPQVQRPGVVWPGWNTQDTEVATRVVREVTWTLEGVQGPGPFTLFLNSDFGKPAAVFDSRRPFPQRTGIDVNTHVHGNWTFGAQGSYLLDITMSARLTDGSTVTDRRPIRLYAGDADPRAAFAVQPAAGTPRSDRSEAPDRRRTWWLWPAGGLALVLALAGAALARRRSRPAG